MKILKKLSVLVLVAIVFSCFSIAANASDNPYTIASIKGDSTINRPVDPLASQVKDLLRNSSPKKRELILDKASKAGVVSADLSEASLSKADLAVLNGSKLIKKPVFTEKRVKTPQFKVADNMQSLALADVMTTSIIANVDMPDYALWPTIYKQEKSDWCSAGTIQTALKYVGATSPSQSTIMNYWESLGYTYPDLPLVRNYINARLPSNYAPYYQEIYAGNQTTFNVCLKYDVENYQPMVLLMKNDTTSTTNWPYRTSGHFCICSGLLTWENNQYFIGDPYYFSTYVSGAGTIGEHKKTWTKLNTVITNKFGAGQQRFVW